MFEPGMLAELDTCEPGIPADLGTNEQGFPLNWASANKACKLNWARLNPVLPLELDADKEFGVLVELGTVEPGALTEPGTSQLGVPVELGVVELRLAAELDASEDGIFGEVCLGKIHVTECGKVVLACHCAEDPCQDAVRLRCSCRGLEDRLYRTEPPFLQNLLQLSRSEVC